MEAQSMSLFGIVYLVATVGIIFGGSMLGAFLYRRHIDRAYQRELKAVTDPNRY